MLHLVQKKNNDDIDGSTPLGMNRHKMLSKWLCVEAPHNAASLSEEEQ